METKLMWGLVLMTMVVALSTTSTGQAVAGPGVSGFGSPCHVLITDMECAAYQLALSTVPTGVVHAHLIADYREIVRERESSCSCNRAAMAEVIYPHVRQLALQI